MKFAATVVKGIWSFLGNQQNHNALIVLITFFGLMLALPYFSKQINNIQVQIDSMDATIRTLYNMRITEVFDKDKIRTATIEPHGSGVDLTLLLESSSIEPKSVNIWWGSMYLNPSDFKVHENRVTIYFDAITVEQSRELLQTTPFTITYLRL